MKTDNYIPIPVSAAKAVAEQFQKSQVVILAFDPVHEVTQTTTYGVSPFDKENAASTGELVTQAIGCDLSKKQTFEDYHQNYEAAEFKALQEKHDAITSMVSRFLIAHRDTHRCWIESFIECGAIKVDFNYHPNYPHIEPVLVQKGEPKS